MVTRVDFAARAPIGRVTIGDQTFLVYATGDMVRQLRTVQDSVNAVESGLAASEIINVPSGGIAATDVQGALDELDTEKASASSVTSGLAGKQDLDATLTAIAGVVTAANKLIYWTGVDTAAATDLTAFARTLLDDSDAGAMRSTLGLVIGTDVQAYDADLTTWAGKTAPSGTVVGTSDTQTLTAKTLASPTLTGTTYFEQVTPTSKAAAGTLTTAELLTAIIEYTGAAATLTLPTGANIDAAIPGMVVNGAFSFYVINTGSGAVALGTAAGLTLTGSMSVANGSSGKFAARKTAASTYTFYRLS